jgi:AcrR family transcriptional regulator
MKPLTRAEKQAQTRQALLDAARDVFIERGFAGASVEQISAAAGFTRGAFYSNFGSKEELFAELLQQQVFETYRQIARAQLARGESPPVGETAEELAALVGDKSKRWALRLLLELLAHAGRDPEFRKLARGFWSETRDLTAKVVAEEHKRIGVEPPADPRAIATSLIALDIGLALQHYVDPGDVPLSLYPELYELLFGPYSTGQMRRTPGKSSDRGM